MGWWKESIDIVKENDPAARTSLEVLLTYPGIKALAAHRLSHFLWRHGFKLLARMHSQFWRFWTQIEIHPGAQIESGVFIDHGSGLVIGETAIVEKGAMLYHGVTLGGTGKDTGNAIRPCVEVLWSLPMLKLLDQLRLVKSQGRSRCSCCGRCPK